jgi:methionyl aminopeptidase
MIIKNAQQIDGIEKSCILAAQTLKYIEPFVVEGTTTEEINKLAEQYIRDHKAIPAPLGYHGYPKAICTSINEVICHGIPDERRLKSGDIINVDVTTILDGYYGDCSTMFAIGEISQEARKLLEVTKKCLNIGIKQAKPGNRVGMIGYEISKYAWSKGYSVVEMYCGHSCGVEFHESPQIPHVANRNYGPVMVPGMIFTIEPMINIGLARAIVDKDGWTARTIDGKLSAQYEHMVLIADRGCKVLTDV